MFTKPRVFTSWKTRGVSITKLKCSTVFSKILVAFFFFFTKRISTGCGKFHSLGMLKHKKLCLSLCMTEDALREKT
jgi:hypothetical protein